jgi:hypothetical protein
MKPRKVCNRAFLMSVFYACLIFIPMHQPGLLFGPIAQLVASACICALLLFVIEYRHEIGDLVKASLQAHVSLLLALLVATEPLWREVCDPASPTEPSPASLFQRPPPKLA